MTDEPTVKIGCRLPQGYVLRWRGDVVSLRGADGALRSADRGFQATADAGIGVIAPTGHGVTEVPARIWLGWLAENDGRNEIRNGSVFLIGQ